MLSRDSGMVRASERLPVARLKGLRGSRLVVVAAVANARLPRYRLFSLNGRLASVVENEGEGERQR